MTVYFADNIKKLRKEHLKESENTEIICGDFITYEFLQKFDVIYSSLTFMHIENKNEAVKKIAALLKNKGRAVISSDKNQDEYIDMGSFKTKVFPDNPKQMLNIFNENGFNNVNLTETEFAYIISGAIDG